jgi:hypothetical protein
MGDKDNEIGMSSSIPSMQQSLPLKMSCLQIMERQDTDENLGGDVHPALSWQLLVTK